MSSRRSESEVLTRQLRGRAVSHVSVPDQQHLCVHFADGSTLVAEATSGGLDFSFNPTSSVEGSAGEPQPTQRQREYLQFITRYIDRFGVAPAESDIQRHFLVSAPTVHQMMKMLEKRGFISRQPGVGRSIRVLINL